MTADEFARKWALTHANSNLLPHRDADGVIFLWDETYEGPPPAKAPPGRRVDPYGNVIQDQPDVTPFTPPPPIAPPPGPRDVRPGGFAQAFLPPLSAERQPRPSFFTPGAGVPAHLPPVTLPPPPTQTPGGVLIPQPGAGFPPTPPAAPAPGFQLPPGLPGLPGLPPPQIPTLPPTQQLPPGLPPPGGFQTPGEAPPSAIAVKRSLLSQIATTLVLTSPAWGTYLYLNRQSLIRSLRR